MNVCLDFRARWPSWKAPAGRAEHFLQRPRQWMGGAPWAGSSQLVVFEASTTAVGEGRPGEVGRRPGAGRGRKGPCVP